MANYNTSDLNGGLHNWHLSEEHLSNLRKFKKVVVADGFPRQANTFLNTSLVWSYPQQEVGITGHTHSIESVSMQGENIYLATSVREPIDTLTSWMVKLGAGNHVMSGNLSDGRIKFMLAHIERYSNMAKSILDREDAEKTLIFSFEDVTKNIDKVVKKISEIIEVEPEISTKNSEEFLLDFKYKYRKMDSTDPTAWSMHGYYPRERHESYESVRKILSSSIFYGGMSKAKNYYDRLIESRVRL